MPMCASNAFNVQFVILLSLCFTFSVASNPLPELIMFRPYPNIQLHYFIKNIINLDLVLIKIYYKITYKV